MSQDMIDQLLLKYDEKKLILETFGIGVLTYFQKHPKLNDSVSPIIHSIKYRIKDRDHLRDKLERKISNGKDINAENFFDKVTDLCGIRIMHLYTDQIKDIHDAILQQTKEEWVLCEEPIAYTWDPDSARFYESLGLRTEIKESYYTSIHYIVKPNNEKSVAKCEIQVRTLFEEVWGEIDHSVNYPYKCEDRNIEVQLKILAKLVATGTNLGQSIYHLIKSKYEM